MRQAGTRAVMVDVEDSLVAHRLAKAVRRQFGDELVEVVPGECSVLVIGRKSLSPRYLADRIECLRLREEPLPGEGLPPLNIPVTYGGAELEALEGRLGRSTDELVCLHSAATYTVRFVGSVAGFGYLGGGDRLFELPPTDEWGRCIAAGSVLVAGGYSGVMPRRLPSGWWVVGHTKAVLWEPEGQFPNRFVPGRKVRFIPLNYPVNEQEDNAKNVGNVKDVGNGDT